MHEDMVLVLSKGATRAIAMVREEAEEAEDKCLGCFDILSA